MKNIFTEMPARKIVAVWLFFILAGNVSGQDEKPLDAPVENSQNTESVEETKPVASESIVKTEVPQEAPKIILNQGVQKIVNEQYRWTPEDPSFLYETRNIPDRKNNEEFLPAELEKVIVKERIKEERDFRKSLEKIKIRLPDLTQTLVLVSVIIILLVYRSRAKKSQDQRR